MEESFGEQVAPTDAIRDILRGYPFSIGLLREILQNSDDAQAKKQVFVLDCRQHPDADLFHPYLAGAQGPALLTYNDGLLKESDWMALRNIHRSSKTNDSNKIGKFGLGFRSCYHITDIPHILSGAHLAILDPQHHFRSDGGVRFNIVDHFETVTNHLHAFDSILSPTLWGSRYDGTIFRFPLRSSSSDISNKTTSPAEISELLRNFVQEELKITLLFLRNISTIEIYEVDRNGKRVSLGGATISRTPFHTYTSQYETRKVIIRTLSAGQSEREEWRVIHAPFSEDHAVNLLSERLGWGALRAVRTFMEDKMTPTVDLAVPSRLSQESTRTGRLFTFLPLPLMTGFPIHINGLFSLTQSRQNLRNADEVGIVGNSEDRARVEWNRLLFDTYIPQAWAMLLEVLIEEDKVPNIFLAWPQSQSDVQSGDAAYWKTITAHVAKHALKLNVWPISGTSPPVYERISSLIVEEKSADLDGIVGALVRTGVQITRLPSYLTEIIMEHYMSSIKVLSPQIAYEKLQSFIRQIKDLSDGDARTILTYLLSTANCNYIIGLPLVPTVSGQRITLHSGSRTVIQHVLFGETEEFLFATFNQNAISLTRMTASARNVLVEHANGGYAILNVAAMDVTHVTGYIGKSDFASQIEGQVTQHQISWLNTFWEWAEEMGYSLFFNRFFLVPTTERTCHPEDLVFDPSEDGHITPMLEALGVSVIDSRLQEGAKQALHNLKPTCNIHALLGAIQTPFLQWIKFTEDDATAMCDFLLKHLQRYEATGKKGDIPLNLLRSLPIYPVLSVSEDGIITSHRAPILTYVDVRGLSPSEIPIFPLLDTMIILDLDLVQPEFLQYLNPMNPRRLSTHDMYKIMLRHFCTQSLQVHIAFVEYLSGPNYIPRFVLDGLSEIAFVPTRNGQRQMPKLLIDPQSSLAELFSARTPYLPSTSHPRIAFLIDGLRHLGLLVTQLTPQIVQERISFINNNHCPESEAIAYALINLLNDAHFDLHRMSETLLSPNASWIPTVKGLKSPQDCRDAFSHHGQTDLFDEALPLVVNEVHIGPHLRNVFGWNGQIPIEILLRQLVGVANSPSPSYQKVYEVLKEIGRRLGTLTQFHYDSLRDALRTKKWVPTRNNTLEKVDAALLGDEEIPEVGFHRVAFDAFRHHEVRIFLRSMGCIERPMKETILNQLSQIYHDQPHNPNSARALGIVQLLGWLPQLPAEDRIHLVVPDDTGRLWPHCEIYFNDVGERGALYEFESGALAHSCISPGLASSLGLQRLGLMGMEQPTNNVGIDLVTVIRSRFSQYKDPQVILDLLYAATEAGATDVNILLDEAVGRMEDLFSPRCQELQRAPALVFQYNAIFTENEAEEMLRTRTFGKSGWKPFAGVYGSGMLAVFSITEFATIVSGNNVWLINPCRSHLGLDNAVLRLPLSTVQRSYSDHLSPLVGLFGFSLTDGASHDSFYDGTILRLPLRESTPSADVDPVLAKTTSLQNLIVDLKPLSPKLFLFTRLTNLQLYDRKHSERQRNRSNTNQHHGLPHLRMLWAVKATRKDSRLSLAHRQLALNAHTVSITHPDSLMADQDWRVISLEANKHSSPPSLGALKNRYRLQEPSIVSIAARLGPTPGAAHNLFSTLPYSIPLELPVHISCPCIVIPDMSSVWLDDLGTGPEVAYNRWLMADIVPVLYLHLLEDRAAISDNSAYWPGASKVEVEDASTDVATLVGDSVYRLSLGKDSGFTIFRSKYDGFLHNHRTARFVNRLPRAVLDVLDVTRPRDLIQLPPLVTRRLQSQNSPHFSTVNPKYLHQQLVDNSVQISSLNLSPSHLQELIDFLSRDTDAYDCLTGLHLLPLEDATFARFEEASATATYFYVAPPQVLEASIFPPSLLVHRALDVAKLLKIDRLNVRPITESSIKTLIGDRIPSSDTLEDASPEDQRWIQSFWKAFSSLKISTNAIARYPLIPTLKSGYFLSFGYCKTSAVLADFSCHVELRQSLSQMGLTIVDTATLPPELRSSLPPLPLTVERVMSKIIGRGREEIHTMFNALNAKTRPAFMSWIRRDWQGRKQGYFNRHKAYLLLPIWESANRTWVCANDAQMLPKTVTITDIGPFASKVVVGHDLVLVEMGLRPPASVRALLDIPPSLDPDSDKAYKHLLTRVLFEFTPENNSIPVPNSQRAMKDSTFLYSSRDELFLAAFGSRSERFVHPTFAYLEPKLEKFGLKRQFNLNVSMFRECVEAFHESTLAEKQINLKEMRARSDAIVRYWSEELPRRITLLNQDQLRTLDNFRFIARHPTPRPLGSDNDSRFIRALPPILSPNELVRAEFQAIAWSQRGLYKPKHQPHPNLLKLHRELSVPTAEEVVSHLVVLATKVAPEHDASCKEILVDHLEQTYDWLEKHTKDAEPSLQKCKTDQLAIFLNVDFPQLTPIEGWNWKKAEHILLDTGTDREYLQYPRIFIKAHRSLLKAAGAVSFNHGRDVKPEVDLPPNEDRYSTLCGTLNRMRRDGICTDVKFTFESPDEQPLHAHRTYLATCSPYFMKRFSKPEVNDTNFAAIPIDCSFSRRCVAALLDYVYISQEPAWDGENQANVKLAVQVLSLAHLWEMSEAKRAIERAIISLRMIDPFTLETIRFAAESTKCEELLSHCNEFAKNNKSVIRRVKEEGGPVLNNLN